MKKGRTLGELAAEITRQMESKRDYLVDTRALTMLPDPGSRLKFADNPYDEDAMAATDHTHRQIGEHVGIPAKYYDRMRHGAPDLLARNVNHWLHEEPATRMVRTLDGRVRAFLSDRYRPLENYDLAEAALPVLRDLDVEIISCELTETRLYVKAVDARINRDIPTGRKMGDGSHVFFDTVSPAIIISNSEVGMGSLSVETGVWTRVCTNLAIAGSRSMKKYHLGGKHELGEELYAMLSDQTRKLTDAAVWGQVRDVVKGAFEQARFDALVAEIAGTAEQKIEGDVAKVVEVTARHLGIGEGERKSVLKHLIEGGDLSRYGLFNAITRTAEDLDDYDRATEFERMGGKLVELPANDWREIAQAA